MPTLDDKKPRRAPPKTVRRAAANPDSVAKTGDEKPAVKPAVKRVRKAVANSTVTKKAGE
jgi:hypothetical protein